MSCGIGTRSSDSSTGREYRSPSWPRSRRNVRNPPSLRRSVSSIYWSKAARMGKRVGATESLYPAGGLARPLAPQRTGEETYRAGFFEGSKGRDQGISRPLVVSRSDWTRAPPREGGGRQAPPVGPCEVTKVPGEVRQRDRWRSSGPGQRLACRMPTSHNKGASGSVRCAHSPYMASTPSGPYAGCSESGFAYVRI